MARKKSDQEKEYKVISLTLHKDILAEVDRLVGQGGNRSAFISRAIEKEIAERKAGRNAAGSGALPGGGQGGPGNVEQAPADLETIRRLVREEIDRRLGSGQGQGAGQGPSAGGGQADDPENRGNKKTGPGGTDLAGTMLDIFKGL